MKKAYSILLLGSVFITFSSFISFNNDEDLFREEHCEETAAELYESYSQYYSQADAYRMSNDYYQDCLDWENEELTPVILD
ncbi:hypothetical protein DSM03_101352 [Leeuwenhoekiella aestuarii]|uniref:Uncharacterized protein n=1 Tax=Leeuwenhoekiella aestuarii TaxID=2249426 RepID=A0A4Q0NSW2_9FLAO|nr:hypothetical protein [Leeuwenhoekiella aestuarii]RXG14235.1 hypothetical protein DSM04_104343 [Leeuwenhoekiella aestuarii]RXG18984.1 hypothetical protein DSM03_101352 [Leeuwenhoekiella aestuarii]